MLQTTRCCTLVLHRCSPIMLRNHVSHPFWNQLLEDIFFNIFTDLPLVQQRVINPFSSCPKCPKYFHIMLKYLSWTSFQSYLIHLISLQGKISFDVNSKLLSWNATYGYLKWWEGILIGSLCQPVKSFILLNLSPLSSFRPSDLCGYVFHFRGNEIFYFSASF